MEDHAQILFFEEEQRFPFWIRAIVLLVVVALGCPAILTFSLRVVSLGLVALSLLAFASVTLAFTTKFVTKLDSSNLHLRIYPQDWRLLPR